MSIVEALLEQVRQETRPGTCVRTVRLRVGKLRQVVPEMLTFCYAAAVNDGSRLEVEEVPAEARCRRCCLTFAVQDHWFECPRCQSSEADLLRGDELQLMSLELVEGRAPSRPSAGCGHDGAWRSNTTSPVRAA